MTQTKKAAQPAVTLDGKRRISLADVLAVAGGARVEIAAHATAFAGPFDPGPVMEELQALTALPPELSAGLRVGSVPVPGAR